MRCPISPELKALLKNVQAHEAYNAEKLEILKARHLPITPSEAPPVGTPIVTGEPSLVTPPARPRSQWTVGSLMQS
ncbi:hypothetical protein D3C78_1745410 [compost metagenome]